MLLIYDNKRILTIILLELKRDRVGLSVYPQGTAGNDASKLPADYFNRLPKLVDESYIIAETGWNSVDLVVASGNCEVL